MFWVQAVLKSPTLEEREERFSSRGSRQEGGRAKRCSAHHWPFWQLPLSQFESLEQAAPWIPQK